MNYTDLASEETLATLSAVLKANNFEPIIVSSKEEALEKIKSFIPAGASVMNGSSRTLEEVGFVDYLKGGAHGWNNLHTAIVAEKDLAKQGALRKQAVLSDYYLGSVHALTEKGEMIVASNTGSQLPHLVFTSPNVILVVATQKIVPSIEEGMKRLHDHVMPLEEVNMQQKYGVGTQESKTFIWHKENPMMGRQIKVILVKEKVGF